MNPITTSKQFNLYTTINGEEDTHILNGRMEELLEDDMENFVTMWEGLADFLEIDRDFELWVECMEEAGLDFENYEDVPALEETTQPTCQDFSTCFNCKKHMDCIPY